MTATETTPAPGTLQQLAPRDTEYTDHKDRLRESFNRYVADGTHAMTILREDGIYRHLRFRKPDRGEYWFDLITWPGYLTITGDMGCYTFARVEDMFTFFTGYINNDYWAEKEQGRSRHELKEHDEDSFRAWVLQDFWGASRHLEPAQAKQWWTMLLDEVLGKHVYASMSTPDDCVDLLRNLGDQQEDQWIREHYDDCWEASWSVYPWHLEMCLAAIVTGIRTYRAHQHAVAVEPLDGDT